MWWTRWTWECTSFQRRRTRWLITWLQKTHGTSDTFTCRSAKSWSCRGLRNLKNQLRKVSTIHLLSIRKRETPRCCHRNSDCRCSTRISEKLIERSMYVCIGLTSPSSTISRHRFTSVSTSKLASPSKLRSLSKRWIVCDSFLKWVRFLLLLSRSKPLKKGESHPSLYEMKEKNTIKFPGVELSLKF